MDRFDAVCTPCLNQKSIYSDTKQVNSYLALRMDGFPRCLRSIYQIRKRTRLLQVDTTLSWESICHFRACKRKKKGIRVHITLKDIQCYTFALRKEKNDSEKAFHRITKTPAWRQDQPRSYIRPTDPLEMLFPDQLSLFSLLTFYTPLVVL